MKLSFLSGAYKNAGDFLIEKRALSIIQKECEGIEINRYLRTDLKEIYEQINDADAIVIGGGPLYASNLDCTLPLDICLDKITIPIMIMGCGWYGAYGSNSLANNYHFTPKTLEFLKKVDSDGLGLSCRDIFTVNALKANDLKNVYMTGCPAWYELTKLDVSELNTSIEFPPKLIAVSDPALTTNYYSAISLTRHLSEKYPDANIKYIFHRGLALDNNDFKKYYNEIRYIPKVEVLDIANDSDGFGIYDTCDLHVGFRVHAHIYNLSIRNKTILIEEDGRGAGVNEALGLVSIKAYNDQIMVEVKNRIFRHIIKELTFLTKTFINTNINTELDSYIDILNSTDNQNLKNAFNMQKAYYQNMKDFVKRLKHK